MESITLFIHLFDNRQGKNVKTSGYIHYVLLWGVWMIKTVHETEIHELATRPRLHKMNIYFTLVLISQNINIPYYFLKKK